MIRIGTRSSPLALYQAHTVQRLLEVRDETLETQIIPMTTSGDQYTKGPLSDIGGKGLFTREIEQALLRGTIDIAVHSMKDVETWLTEGTCIAAMLKRADPRDVWLCPQGISFTDIPKDFRVGTSSLRRVTQVLNRHPHCQIVGVRGNVQTRLQKLTDGACDALILAYAGLQRLDIQLPYMTPLPPDHLVPSVGQGAIGIQCLSNRHDLIEILKAIGDPETESCVTLERAFLEEIDGSCGTPVGGWASFLSDGRIHFKCMVGSPDGKQLQTKDLSLALEDADPTIRALGQELSQWLDAVGGR